MNMSSSSPEKPTTNWQLVKFLIPFLVIGTIFGSVFIYLQTIGMFEKWSLITRVPENTQEILAGGPGTAYIQASDGQVLSCSTGAAYCIIPYEMISSSYPKLSTQSCNRKGIAFSLVAKPPENQIYCTTINNEYADGGFEMIYVIDRDHDRGNGS